jgi:hypothetical protein
MNDEVTSAHDDGSHPGEAEIRDGADLLEKTLGLSPQTARASSEDQATTGMRKPASDRVEAARIAAAQTDGDET